MVNFLMQSSQQDAAGPPQPDGPPASPAPVGGAAVDPVQTLRLMAMGLTAMEQRLLEGTVKVSQRRNPRLVMLNVNQAMDADVLILNARDAGASQWARENTWILGKAVIWVEGTDVPKGHTIARRPVQWPILPMLLARALENGPGAAVKKTEPSTQGDSARAKDPGAVAPAPLRSHQSVLVVDDSLAVRAHLRTQLELRGFVVTDADSVQSAMGKLTKQVFDCVLMDVLMPGADGYEGCRQIKARQRGGRTLPVIMLTSKTSPFDRIRGKMAGCDAYLTKPVDPEQLYDVLTQQLQAAQAAGGATRPASEGGGGSTLGLTRPA